MKMLDGPAAESAIRSLLERSRTIRIAVAYWGSDASRRLGLDALRDRDVLIVCDLLSGGCNPKEVRKLQETLGPERVLTQDQLHAKLWITENGVILGSSNASANGLGAEGDETVGLKEANLEVSQQSFIEEANHWFDRHVSPCARIITSADLQKAGKRWVMRRRRRPVVQYGILDKIVVSNPDAVEDRDIYVWVWEQDELSQDAKKTLKYERTRRHSDQLDCWENVIDPPPPGSYIIDFDSFGLGAPKFHGAWKVLDDDHIVKSKTGELLLALKCSRILDWPLGSRRAWRVAAQLASKSGETEWTITDFARRFMDQPASSAISTATSASR